MMQFFLAHWRWFAFSLSALYTLGGLVWTIRAERLLRKLRSEQKVIAWSYNDLRADVEQIESFLESGNTIRRIKVVPIKCGSKECPR